MDGKAFLEGLDALFREKKIEAAGEWLERHHVQAEEEADPGSLLLVLNEEIGYYRSVSRHERACRAFEDSREVMEQLGIREGASYATTLLNGATAYRAAGNYEKALKLYAQSEAAYVEAGIEGTYENAGLYNNMSLLFEKIGKKEEAIQSLRKALDIIRKLPDCEVETATTYTNLGLLYLGLGRKNAAMEELNKARGLFERESGKKDAHYGAALGGLGQAYYEAGDYDTSVAMYEKAIQEVEESFGRNESYELLCDNCIFVCEQSGNKKKAEEIRKKKQGMHIRGLELGRRYFEECARGVLEQEFPDAYDRMTIGLAGHGSECYGYDDELSVDHDFGPSFCIWMDDADVQKYGDEVQKVYDRLPGTFLGVSARKISAHGEGRIGVKSTREFYEEFLGLTEVPKTLTQWLFLPEERLAAAANGEIFKEGRGSFMEIRKTILRYYPEDVRIKKIAARAAVMAQAGQYNYSRLMMRKDYVGAALAVSEFLKAAISMVYLLNRRYMPYYKWMYRGLADCPVLSDVREYMEELAKMAPQEEAWEGLSVSAYRYGINVKDYRVVYIETICRRVREELTEQGLISGTDAFLETHTAEILSHIKDQELKTMHVMIG